MFSSLLCVCLETVITLPSSTSSLLSGDLSANVINSCMYISLQTSVAQERDRQVGSVSLDSAVCTTLCAERKNVILVGPEGAGKTTALEKLVLDWAKGERLQSFIYVFHFNLKELNGLQEMLSLETLMLRHSCVPPDSMTPLLQNSEHVLLVFDDLHVFSHCLDPSLHTLCADPCQVVSPGCLVASLLHGSLLKGASFVVASRQSGRLKFLSGTQMEVLGFLKPQREAYFNRAFTDPTLANKAIAHLEKTLGFYEFCSSPRFCWTVCSLYKSLMNAGEELPETVSQLCVGVLVYLIQEVLLTTACSRELMLALGKMASHCFLNQHLSCTREELGSFGLEKFLEAAAVFLQVDGEQLDTRVFSFPSQLMQEFLIAVSYLWSSASTEGVEEILEKHRGHAKLLDSFLSALSEPVQRRPLETVLGEPNADRVADFKRWLKSSSEEALRGYHKDQHHHYFHLLHQAQSKSLVKEVITITARMGISYADLSLQESVALNYVVECLGEMEKLNLYLSRNLTEEQVEALAPAMSLSHQIMLMDSRLSSGAVAHLASALSRGITTELDLSQSQLGDEKFKVLCAGLRDCKLTTLKLQVCRLTELSCDDLASVLSSGTARLQRLAMRHNQIGDRGFVKLCTGLRSPHCKLQELQIQSCKLTAASMGALSAALTSGQSELRKVDLTLNSIGLPGVASLCEALQHPSCKLQRLVFYDCSLTGESCPHFKEALMSKHCRLSELDLSVNELGQEGALLLCHALGRPGCPVEKLGCDLNKPVFEELGSLLRSGSSLLKSLSVGLNKVGDQGVKHLWEAVAHPNCLLEELDVEMTSLTDACVEDLCAALRATKTLRNLGLSNNSLTDYASSSSYNDFSEDVFEVFETCDKIRF
uniref:Si:ch73-233m11.2 n=1 Tax=Takifugu rubripes TaxID=31033 RepID=A0A674PBX8_TAKRU